MLPGVDSTGSQVDKNMRIVFQKPKKLHATTLHAPQTSWARNNLDLRIAMTQQEKQQQMQIFDQQKLRFRNPPVRLGSTRNDFMHTQNVKMSIATDFSPRSKVPNQTNSSLNDRYFSIQHGTSASVRNSQLASLGDHSFHVYNL